jgi:cytochrome c oxidase subunit 4
MGGHSVEEIKRETRVYLNVFVALAAFTAITVGISYMHVSFSMHLTLALLVAVIKGTLVACYFMHLLSERKLIYTVLLITAGFFVVLLFLPLGSVLGGTGG